MNVGLAAKNRPYRAETDLQTSETWLANPVGSFAHLIPNPLHEHLPRVAFDVRKGFEFSDGTSE